MSSNDAAGLYVHVPFCASKCRYCGFYSEPSPGLIPAWLGAVRREASQYRERLPAFDTVYIGGGTPSLLTAVQLTSLIEDLRDAFDISGEAEVTIEANPDDVTREKLGLYGTLGINRISLGVQSFHDGELRFLGRRHDAAGALRALELVRGSRIGNVGIDLMFGYSCQTGASWECTLKRALEFFPDHISCYQLTVEPATPFGTMLSRGVTAQAGERAQRRMFLRASELLRGHGFIHYEVSNFARTESTVSRHNVKYWRHAPYLGLGPSAHSFHGRRRWWNVGSVRRYCGVLSRGLGAVEGSEVLTDEQMELEGLYFGFRTRDGVDLNAIRNVPHYQRVIGDLERGSLARIVDGRLVPSTEGFLFADRLPLEFGA